MNMSRIIQHIVEAKAFHKVIVAVIVVAGILAISILASLVRPARPLAFAGADNKAALKSKPPGPQI